MKGNKSGTKQILYLSYDGLSDPLGQSQILPYLIGLSYKEISITIISFEKSDILRTRKKKITDICESHHIHWVPLRYHKNPKIISTVFDIIMLWRTVKVLFKNTSFDIVHCRSYITSFVGIHLKRKFGTKYIFDMRGFWPDERVEGKIWNLRNPIYNMIYKYFKNKEIKFLCEADKIITLTNNAKREIKSWISSELLSKEIFEKSYVIPTCVDTELFSASKVNLEDINLRRKLLGLKKESNILLYLGSLGTWYLLDEMLDFFECMQIQMPGSIFLFLTFDHKFLKDALKKRNWNLINKSFNPGNENSDSISSPICFFSHSKVHQDSRIILVSSYQDSIPVYISMSTASICFIKPSFSKKASFATKIGEVMAMGKPIISNAGWGDVDKLFEDDQYGYLIKEFNVDNYLKIIEKIADGSFIKIDKNHEYLPEFMRLEKGIESYYNIYKNLAAI